MMLIERVFSFPSGNTFDIEPIGQLVKRYLRAAGVSTDPFARDKRWATYTNDLNPNTAAEWHMDSAVFLEMLVSQKVKADLVIFDPPYSPRQIKEVYEGIGLKMTQQDGWRTNGWKRERKAINELVNVGGHVISFGWHTNGIGKYYGFCMKEMLIVNHGWGHNDTLCVVEEKNSHQNGISWELGNFAAERGGA